MEIIKTPWKNKLLELISNSKKSIKILSPFVKENVCNDILSVKQENSIIELITSFKLMSIYSGSVDVNGLEKIIKDKGTVKNFPQLHAKLYLFDDKEVIITSANLTNGGLLNNYEYGVYLKDIKLVSKVVSDFNLISNNENTGNVKLSDIKAVRELLSKIPKSDSLKLPKYEIETPEKNLDIIEISEDIILSSLKGWKMEVFKCLQDIPSQIFTLNEINKFEYKLKAIYPSNNNILAKIRQQLQYLRDLGLIEFLGNGLYKKLWKSKK